MPPRTAYSPDSRTVEARRKPLVSSQRTSASISTALPGAAEKLSAAMRASGGARCVRALTVVSKTRGRSSEERVRARRDSVVMRLATSAALGDTRS
jgi:hypothetical protein